MNRGRTYESEKEFGRRDVFLVGFLFGVAPGEAEDFVSYLEPLHSRSNFDHCAGCAVT